jgi:hypothetical protein
MELTSDEAMALSGVRDAMSVWRHVLEKDVEKMPGQTIIICPRVLSKLGLVASTGNIGMDDREELWLNKIRGMAPVDVSCPQKMIINNK